MKVKLLITIAFLSSFISVFAGKVYADVSSSENYILQEDVIDVAGGSSSSETYSLLTNMGEDVIGQSSSANWALDSGFIKPSYIEIIVDSNEVTLGPVGYPDYDTETTQVTVYCTEVAYTLSTYFLFPDYTDTLLHVDRSTYMEEKTDWDPTAGGGNGNAAVWSGSGFGFTLYSNSQGDKDTTWWGTGTTETDANNKYAGFPSTAQTILEADGYSASGQNTNIGYKLAPSETQKYGRYYGHVFYQATIDL